MSCLHYQGDELFIEDVSLQHIARQFGTPVYVYSKIGIIQNWREYDSAFQAIPHRLCYAVKSCSNIAILRLLAELNAGFDIVSLGELQRVLAAGGNPRQIVFSGVGKTEHEIQQAITHDIFCFDVESEAELERIAQISAALNQSVRIALRVNPNVDPRTHSYISTGMKENKFGIDIENALPLAKHIKQHSTLKLTGIAAHIGSQIVDLKPLLLSASRLRELYLALKSADIALDHINIGGGLGIVYQNEQPPAVLDYANAIKQAFQDCPIDIILEPGRAIVGNAGCLLTRVEYLKHHHQKNFAIVDAGMNDLLRPALYNAWQNIVPAQLRSIEKKRYDIAGPVCESADFLGKDRELAIVPGDLLAIDSTGAYGFSMSSNYNSRCRPAEVLVEHDRIQLIRRRETIADLLALEQSATE